MNELRRYEVLVPLLFNDGTPVPDSLLVRTFTELRARFGAASWETQTLRGSWEHEGAIYHDNLARFFVDVSIFQSTANSSGCLRSNSRTASNSSISGSRRIPSM